MADNGTIISKLRVLVAKSFRAEKLYASIRNPNLASRTAHINDGTGLSSLAEIANSLRAKEWQRSHGELRGALNDILADGMVSSTLVRVAELQGKFAERARESAATVDSGSREVIDSVKRVEFGHVLKVTVELIRQRAKAQANQAIADELASVIESFGRTPAQITARATSSRAITERPPEQVSAVSSPEMQGERLANVIPFTAARRAAGGSRGGR